MREGSSSGLAWLGVGSKERVRHNYPGVKSAYASFIPEYI